jgi:hypothetical protein
MEADEELKKKLDELAELRGQEIITREEWETQRKALLASRFGTAAPPTPEPAPPSAAPAPVSQAPVEHAPYQPVKKSGGGLMKWGLGGCIGILALIGLLVVGGCVVILASLSSDDDTRELLTGNAADVTVKVTAAEAIAFSGSIGAGGSQRSVEGTTPMDFTVSGDDSSGIFVAVMPKQQEAGTLTVTLTCRGGDKTGSTDAAYGVVTVSC